MTTTPFAPRTPYIAVAPASFRISIRSTSPGLSQDNPRPVVTCTGIPSTTYNGSVSPWMDPRPRIWTEMPPLGNRMTCTPALRPSSSSSTCAAGMPCTSTALTVETAVAVISSDGAPTGGADAGGWAHPNHSTVAATSTTPAELPRALRFTALVPRVLLQACDGGFTRRDRIQGVSRREGRAHEQGGPARDHAVLPDDVGPALLLHPQLHAALLPNGIEQCLSCGGPVWGPPLRRAGGGP